jgi:hypothetical protein
VFLKAAGNREGSLSEKNQSGMKDEWVVRTCHVIVADVCSRDSAETP